MAQPKDTAVRTRPIATTITSKRQKTDKLVARCQSDFHSRLSLNGPDMFLIPPDIGSQLYDWYEQNCRSIEGDDEDLDITPLPFELQVYNKEEVRLNRGAGKETRPSRKKRLQSPYSLVLQTPKRRKRTTSPISSDLSNIESVFSPLEQRGESATSDDSGDHPSIKITPESIPLQQEEPSPEALPATRAIPLFPSQPSNDIFDESPVIQRRTRPASFPLSWEDAHEADKMIVRSRQDNQSWSTVAHRWKDITGHIDHVGHLAWRYENLKKRLGLSPSKDMRTKTSME